jgi:hypothetical protein
MKEYKVTFLRKKIQYETCEMILQASDRESVSSETEYWLDQCSCDGSHPPEMEWEEDVSEYDRELSCPYVDSIEEVK